MPSPSFDLNAQEWLFSTIWMTLKEQGALITNISKAIIDGDKATAKRLQGGAIGRIYWRRKPNRPAIPPAVRRAVLARDGAACTSCLSTDRIELDHIVPYSRGGLGTVENLQVLCKACNRRKGASA